MLCRVRGQYCTHHTLPKVPVVGGVRGEGKGGYGAYLNWSVVRSARMLVCGSDRIWNATERWWFSRTLMSLYLIASSVWALHWYRLFSPGCCREQGIVKGALCGVSSYVNVVAEGGDDEGELVKRGEEGGCTRVGEEE